MHIERIQVEEGFLDGLDLQFTPGLNTIIGARGTGKTSIIELIRFCFGIQGHTPESTRRSNEHAISILEGGQVTITVRDGSTAYSLSRTADGRGKQDRTGTRAPIIFSQTEIEAVGLQPGGRLSLIDAFSTATADDKESATISNAVSMTSQISSLCREIEELQTSLTELPGLAQKLIDLQPAEENLKNVSVDAGEKTKAVNVLTKELSALAVADSALARFIQFIDRLRSALSEIGNVRLRPEPWPSSAGEDPLEIERAEAIEVLSSLRLLAQRLEKLRDRSAAVEATFSGRRVPLEAKSRAIRKQIEALQSGAGEISRQGQLLRERIAQVESLKQVVETKRASLQELVARRNKFLDNLSQIREQRFLSRQQVATSLNKALGPKIRITIERSGQHQPYSAFVTEALKGSGLRYNELAPLVSRNMSPRELLEAAEGGDFDLISDATGISRDRALRFISALRAADLGGIATVALEDEVTLSLLDGKDYKGIEELSTGQRCTVVLPIILRHIDRVVIVDQPEDHIDNAFITQTLIKALLERKPSGQIIFATHNANIPVLGAANHVVQLGSDGHRGFPLVDGELEAPPVVTAISNVMEGGADAFKRRAAFYSGHRNGSR